MTTERLILRIGSLLLFASGFAFTLMPEFFARLAGIEAAGAGLTDMRAVYGGAQFAIGGFLFWCERDPARTTAGLMALLFFCVDIGTVRLLGLLVEGDFAAYQFANLAVELGAALGIGAVLWRSDETLHATA